MSYFVLVEELQSKRQGHPVYFEKWTAIGPCCTYDLSKAEKWVTEHGAIDHPAFSHPLCFFEPKEITEEPKP